MSALLLAAVAASLTIQPGESWMVRVRNGQPVAQRKVAATALPAPGEIRFTARRLIGTTLTAVNNSPTSYAFRATLVDASGKSVAARSCALPANNRLMMESWPQAAVAIRIADFRVTRDAACR